MQELLKKAQAYLRQAKGHAPAIGLGLLLLSMNDCYYQVPIGSYGITFNRLTGRISSTPAHEGINLKLPWIEEATLYNVQTREFEIHGDTNNRDMQKVSITLRVLYHPDTSHLRDIHLTLGKNYDSKIIPTLGNEILRTVVAQFSANQLMAQRELVSDRIRTLFAERALRFHVIIDNSSIADLTFGQEYLDAIESTSRHAGKQVAQQEAERAKYEVEQAKEVKKSTIIKAEASAKAIQLVGEASQANPCTLADAVYLDVRRIEYVEKIAQVLAESRNHILLNNDILNMRLPHLSAHAQTL